MIELHEEEYAALQIELTTLRAAVVKLHAALESAINEIIDRMEVPGDSIPDDIIDARDKYRPTTQAGGAG